MSKLTTDFPDWTDNQRRDGVRVRRWHTIWIIDHPQHGERISCPCCDKPFSTERAAKLVADAFYPVAPLQ